MYDVTKISASGAGDLAFEARCMRKSKMHAKSGGRCKLCDKFVEVNTTKMRATSTQQALKLVPKRFEDPVERRLR